MFENVNYTYYSETLGRAIIPDEPTFNKYVLENEMEFKNLWNLGIVREVEKDGIAKAVCMMIEVQFIDEQTIKGEGDVGVASESISGYSYSLSDLAKMTQTQNFNTTSAKKLKWIELFCSITRGIA